MRMNLYDAAVAYMNDYLNYLSHGDDITFAQWLSMENVIITDYDLITDDYNEIGTALIADYGQGDEIPKHEFKALLKELELEQYSKESEILL